MEDGTDRGLISDIEGQGFDGKGGLGLGIGSIIQTGMIQKRIATLATKNCQTTVRLQSGIYDHREVGLATV